MATGEAFQEERDRQAYALMRGIFTHNVRRSYLIGKRTRQEVVQRLQEGGWHDTLEIIELLAEWDSSIDKSLEKRYNTPQI